jgi:hypothetical protein
MARGTRPAFRAKMRTISLGLIPIAGVVACGGVVEDSGGNASSATTGATPSGNIDPTTFPAPDVAPFTAAEVAQAKARCALPEGSVEDVTVRSDVEAHVVGAWYRCDANGGFGPRSDGIQLLPDLSFASLVRADDGSIAATQGFDSTGRWEPYNSAGSSVGEHWYVDFYCGACAGDANTIPVFETNPRRLKAHLWSEGGWLVPLVHIR